MSKELKHWSTKAPLIVPGLILCEGKSDAAFFLALLQDRGIDNYWPIYPTGDSGDWGRSGYSRTLEGLRARAGFKNVTKLIVTGDNDGNPDKQWVDLRADVRGKGYMCPDEPFVLSEQGEPRVAAIMLPGTGRHGNLETLLLDGCSWDATQQGCLDTYCECFKYDDWKEGNKAKMRLRCMIAASCSKDPQISTVRIWNDQDNPISISHSCFDPLADFLRDPA